VGAPVVIAAGALQKDNQTGKVFAQLKIRNIQDKVIKAATVKITPFDTVGKPLGGTADYQYLDLSAKRDTDFGQKTPVMLKEAATRSFAASVSEVIFSDNSTWTASNEAWEPLSAPVTPDKEFILAKQYRVKYGTDCTCVFKKEKDLWRCACGAVNHDSEMNCHTCQRAAAALAALNVEELKADRDKRLAAEQKKAAEEKAAAEAQAKKTKKIAMIATPIVVVAIVAAVLISNFVKAQQEEAARLDAYNTAVELAEAGQYDEAIAAFAELGDYMDSAEQTEHLKHSVEQIKETAYNQAVTLFENGEFDEAYAAFEEAGDYKDSEAMRKLCSDGETIVLIAFTRMSMFGDDPAETFDVVYHTQAEMFIIKEPLI
jgi:tetratricopeptide (TPR) repeat protein